MSPYNRLILPVLLVSLAILAACGGSSNPTVTPPPTGGFSNSNLSGTYVFSVTGSVSDSISDFVTIMGVFTADGKGNISGGVVDQNSTAPNGLIHQTAVTSGSYNIGSDGRPTGSSNLPTGLISLQTSQGTFQFDYVLTSSGHGLVTEFDNFGSASGTLDLQSTVTQGNINGQSYAFNFTGAANASGTVICNLNVGPTVVVAPYATVGAFTLGSSGTISTGLADFNNNCSSSGLTNIPITAGSVTLGTNSGTAAITTGTGTSAVTYNFDVFPIDATHLKFIETDSLPILVGDAFTQASSIPTGNNVYTVAGFDNSASAAGPFTAAGLIVTDGSGNITNASTEDINDAFAASTVNGITGSYTALTGGRAQLTFLTGFVNGNGGTACANNCIFAVYPSTGGLQMLEIDNGGMTNGIAYAQTATSLASGQGYGMNLSGANTTSSEDDIAEFTNNNSSFSGIIDINQQGSTSFRNAFSANYTADSTVPGRGTVNPTKNGFLLATYVVDSATAVAVSTDSSLVGLGALVTQNASAKSNAVANHLAVLRMAPTARMKSSAKKAIPTRSN